MRPNYKEVMKPTGRRAWRKWLRSQRKHDKDSWSALLGAVRGRASYARKHRGTNAGQGLPEEPGTDTVRSFTARSLVGMTQGARKRRARGLVGDLGHMLYGDYRIGQRLRPCPGCAKCHPATRRFAPTAGWKSPRKWILWDGAKLWMIARTWRRLCTVPTLADYTSGVDDGTWKELFCDGSGVLPAKRSAQ